MAFGEHGLALTFGALAALAAGSAWAARGSANRRAFYLQERGGRKPLLVPGCVAIPPHEEPICLASLVEARHAADAEAALRGRPVEVRDASNARRAYTAQPPRGSSARRRPSPPSARSRRACHA